MTQLVERTFTHALCHTHEPAVKHVVDALRIQRGEIAQFRAALSLTCKTLPIMQTLIERAFLKDSLPFPAPAELIAHGFNKSVWKLTPDDQSDPIACRVHFYTIGQSSAQLISSAAKKRETYEKVLTAFGGFEDLIVPSHFIVANAPTLGKGAVVEVSPFVEGVDVFEHADAAFLTDKQKGHLGVIAEIASHKIGDSHLDLLGENNILVNTSGETRVVDWEPAVLPDHDHSYRHYQRIKQLRALAA